MIDLHAGRVDTRPTIHDTSYRGKQIAGSKTTHAIQTESVWRRLAHCGVALDLALGFDNRARITCPGCLAQLRELGYAG